MNAFLKNVCVILLVLGVTIILENNCKYGVSVTGFVSTQRVAVWVEPATGKIFFMNPNLIGAEVEEGGSQSFEVKPGTYIIEWIKYLGGRSTVLKKETFVAEEGQTKVLKSCD